MNLYSVHPGKQAHSAPIVPRRKDYEKIDLDEVELLGNF